jgi:penicillin-binding protein 2
MPPTDDRRRDPTRLIALQVCLVGTFVVLLFSFWYLQVVEGDSYVELARNNNQRTLALRAERGVLFDRDLKVLVESRRSFTVSIDRKLTQDMTATIRQVAELAGLDVREVQQTVERRRRNDPIYQSIRIIEDATPEQVFALRAHQFELPNVVIEDVPARSYPAGSLAAHLFGYVGEARTEQLNDRITRGSIVGQSGVELVYNRFLMGEDGERRIVINSVGREVDRLPGEHRPIEGRRVQLTIDYDLQKAAEDGFRATGFNGAALIMDPRNGEVLTYVSLPAYDPNDFAARIDSTTWASLNSDKLRPLSNRVISGRYSPGSTFKIVVATAALEEGTVTPDHQIRCTGGAYFFGRYYKCHLKGGHGTLDMRHAIEKSCNVYFYTLGNMLGVDRINKWAVKLGLAGKTGIDLPNEIESIVPSTEWKQRVRGERWYPGETISVSIGQGQVSVTPASLALMISTVANGGTRVTPHVVKVVDEGAGWKPVERSVVADHVAFKPDTLAALRDGLWMVVNAQGTGGRGRIDGRDVAGKTGTAQVISNEGRERARNSGLDLRDHGWFVFFAPRDNPEIAGVIFAEHGEHGYLGAPIAKHVIETYFAKKERQPLPALKIPGKPSVPEEDPDSPSIQLPSPVADATAPAPGPIADVRTTPVLPR